MPREPRMDGVLVRDPAGGWWVREGRRVRAGDEIVLGRAEDGSEGVLVHSRGFQADSGAHGDFHFMSSQVSREKPIVTASANCDDIACSRSSSGTSSGPAA